MKQNCRTAKTLLRRVPPVVYMLFVLILSFGLASDRFLTFRNFSNILQQTSPLMILAFGQTLVVLSQATGLIYFFFCTEETGGWKSASGFLIQKPQTANTMTVTMPRKTNEDLHAPTVSGVKAW